MPNKLILTRQSISRFESSYNKCTWHHWNLVLVILYQEL